VLTVLADKMVNPFKNYTPEQKEKALNRMLTIFCITVFLIGSFWAIYSWKTHEKLNYTFVLEGENMSSIMVCEDMWHYELIDSFIPCVVNGTVGGIGGDTIDWSLSPQDNCKNVDGAFIGLNVYNDTRAKELYDQLLPRCFEIMEENISYVWLNSNECLCLDSGKFEKNCDEYDCGGGLIVKRK